MKIGRRRFTQGLVALPAAIAANQAGLWLPRSAQANPLQFPEYVLSALDTSPYVYISPLSAKGAESKCHGEVWFAWLDNSVVVTVGSDSWKARALKKGRNRARIWVGNFGRWKTLTGTNDDYRKGSNFDATAEKVTDRKVLVKLLGRYDEKYPGEIDSWRGKMKKGFEDGSRTLIRYTPIGIAPPA